jgi:hypothetical protein
MHHYDYQENFKRLFDKAVTLYGKGNHDKDTYFNSDDSAFIAANGWRIQDFFDYAEDLIHHNDPSYEIAQSIEQVRREYFFRIQKEIASDERISSSDLPGKSKALDGIVWLPRILPKARAKLLGQLPEETMYCCGGDRHFLQTHDIHPAEFLRVVWANLDSDAGIVEFVKSRSS